MNITEKLGITPGPWNYNSPLGVYSETRWNKSGEHEIIASEVKFSDICLISTAPEMLEALIETTMYMEDVGYKEGLVESNIPIIEKATGKTWEEIRGMM